MKLTFRYESDEGHVLEFTEKDIAELEFSTPIDVEDITKPGMKAREVKFTTAHVKFDATFPATRLPRWVNPGEQ